MSDSIRNPIHQQIKEQDDNLELLEEGVDRLKAIADNINRESKEQGKMVDGLSKDMNNSTNKIDNVNNRLGKLIRKVAEDNSPKIIVVLIIIVIILFFVCFYA